MENDRSLRSAKAIESGRSRIEIETSVHSELHQTELSAPQQLLVDNGDYKRRFKHIERKLQWQFKQRCDRLQLRKTLRILLNHSISTGISVVWSTFTLI